MTPPASPKFAPAREDGLKPYHVTISMFAGSFKTTRIIYAERASQAEYEAKGRQLYTYAKARRATPADMEDTRHE